MKVCLGSLTRWWFLVVLVQGSISCAFGVELSLDLSFGEKGTLIRSLRSKDEPPGIEQWEFNKPDVFGAIEDSAGRLIAFGTYRTAGAQYRARMVRIDPAESRVFDETFGEKGIAELKLPEDFRLSVVRMDNKQRLILGGQLLHYPHKFGVTYRVWAGLARFTPDGKPDLDFRTSGHLFMPSVGGKNSNENLQVEQVEILGDRSIVALFTYRSMAWARLYRFFENGDLDQEYGQPTGTALTAPLFVTTSTILAKDANDNLYATGYSHLTRWGLARLDRRGRFEDVYYLPPVNREYPYKLVVENNRVISAMGFFKSEGKGSTELIGWFHSAERSVLGSALSNLFDFTVRPPQISNAKLSPIDFVTLRDGSRLLLLTNLVPGPKNPWSINALIAKVSQEGFLDESFGQQGLITVPWKSVSLPQNIFIDQKKRVVVTGATMETLESEFQLAITRFNLKYD
jgi:hypothetical protein